MVGELQSIVEPDQTVYDLIAQADILSKRGIDSG